jgi:mRNA-degrading endonuclease RelE of RelBE toxin-antitoxin system
LKRIVIADEAKADIRAIPQQMAMRILMAIHRLADSNHGDVKALQGNSGDLRLRVGDYRVRFIEDDFGVLKILAVRHRKDAYR